MTSTARAAQQADPDDPPPAPRRVVRRSVDRLRPHLPDLAICLGFLLLAAFVMHGLWPSPNSKVLGLNPEDQTLYEWILAVDSRVLHGDFSLLTDRLNAPDGVNLMANTTVIALGALFSPVTLLFGAPVTFAVLATLTLGLTAVAFYLLFRRVLRTHRLAAAIGGGFCGFAPGMVSQNNSHLHMTALWLVPVLVWAVVSIVRAADPTDPVNEGRDGRRGWRRIVVFSVVLALTVAVQVFIGEEVLFLTALTLVIMTLVYAAARPDLTRRVVGGAAAGLGIAVVLSVLVLAYPLWFQFKGPQSVPNGVFSPHFFSADLASFKTVSPLSLFGREENARLSTGPAEYNTFLGWPLILVAIGCAVWLIRKPLVLACTIAAVVMAALSLGPDLVVNGTRTEVWGPYRLLLGLPVVDGALPMRFALALMPLIATVLVVAVDAALKLDWQPGRLLVPALVAIALLPLFPKPLPVVDRAPVPEFISGGHWRECVSPGGVLVPVPPATPKEPWPMRWSAAADAGFAIPEGFFIAPYGAEGTASMGTYSQPTSQLIKQAATEGVVPGIGDFQRAQARQDFAFWHAECVVLADGTVNEATLRTTLEQLLGPGRRIADATTWKVG
ncbi:hypothetical protein [Asanoa iriomotensis]|uniref:Glycosyl transferase n=1 Tax=Asanoa iriomotensis TaxID=234613 RepID=A0ABQ4BVF3_9ACTN|nr:hypothetical protein [Asanoa iriomotensis]GIF54508.1 glycosyl transferase [Asanoa iriomotensis]